MILYLNFLKNKNGFCWVLEAIFSKFHIMITYTIEKSIYLCISLESMQPSQPIKLIIYSFSSLTIVSTLSEKFPQLKFLQFPIFPLITIVQSIQKSRKTPATSKQRFYRASNSIYFIILFDRKSFLNWKTF